MSPKLKYFLLSFLTGGIIFALLGWATDSVDGKDFELVRFLLRAIGFGIIMSLAPSIGRLGDKSKIEKKRS